MTDSAEVATALATSLRACGVTDVVLAPGSRSAPLALAVFEADRMRRLRLHVRIDERTCGFLALGLAKGSHRPVAVVTTSGSAVAHLHPSVLEATSVGEPVIVLSADRPAEMRGTGANQATEQVGMFGPRVPCVDVEPGDGGAAVRAVEAAVHRPGPSHINLQFAEPLVAPTYDSVAESRWTEAAPGVEEDLAVPGAVAEVLAPGRRTVVVAGDGAGPAARLLAESANWPLFAEPTSGARTGRCAIRSYRLLLEQPDFAARIERVVVAGHPTLSRPVTRLISRADVDVISTPGPGGVHTDPGRVARRVDTLPHATEPDNATWLNNWRGADSRLSAHVDNFVNTGGAATLPLRVAAEVALAVIPGSLLFAGSSSPVRDLDVMATPYPVGERRLIIGNRGLSGIDGSMSTAVGAALGRSSPRALAYIGDLAFLHDATALVLGHDEPRPDLTIVVQNDDGGAIFATLEQGDARFAAGFERIFGTPHGVQLQQLCAATGTPYKRISGTEELRDGLGESAVGIRVLEVPVTRDSRRQVAARLHELAGENELRKPDQARGRPQQAQ